MSEILGTLFKYLLALLAITAVVAVLYEALGSNNVSTAVSEITTLQANVSQLYSGSTLPASGDITATLISAKAVPASMGQASGSTGGLIGPWGSTITLAAVGNGNVALTMNNVPQDGCNKLVPAVIGSMVSVSVTPTSGGTANTDLLGSDATLTADVAKACGVGNTVIFTFVG